jgi:hypothetical protein
MLGGFNMIRFQIVEHLGAEVYRSLLDAMKTGSLLTFSASKRGRKITHVKYPGWINWSSSEGVITCEVLSPQKPANEWQLMHAFMGRLAARFAPSIVAINIQFPRKIESTNAPSWGRRNAKKTRSQR